MLLKRKSFAVTLVSGFVLASVLILTLVGYIAYKELKNEESKRLYQYSLDRINAKVYVKHIKE
jgi:predicted membrane protein